MEATGRDGGAGGPSWSYRRRHEEIGSSSDTISSSSRSGTIVSSTAYTSGASRSSRLSTGISMEPGISTEAAALLKLELELELRLDTPKPDEKDAEFARAIKKHRAEIDGKRTWKEMRMKHTESLVQEFFRGPSENRSILGGSGGGMSALERWFSELRVSWVLQLDVGASARRPRLDEAWDWSEALRKIMETIHLTESFFPGMAGINEEEVDSREQATSPDPVQFALFFQKAMSTMLFLIDVMLSKSLKSVCLQTCLIVYEALSVALSGIRLQFHSPPSAAVQTIEKEMVSLLSAKQGKVFEGTWSILEEIMTSDLKSIKEYSSGSQTPQGSADIHEATKLLTNRYIDVLLGNASAAASLASQALSLGKYVPQTALGEAPPLISFITEMVSCFEDKLVTKSQSFLDKGLGLLFLLNNSKYILDSVGILGISSKVDLAAVISFITHKIEHYKESYIKVSWEPMLACLFNPTPLHLVRKYSPLSKFESEFQKIYATQKFWKVRDPGLRERLRKAVIEKVIPAYTKHIEDSKVTNPKFTPQEMEDLLQELFER